MTNGFKTKINPGSELIKRQIYFIIWGMCVEATGERKYCRVYGRPNCRTVGAATVRLGLAICYE